ncbi:helix-turn-helix transcriptional regulator [Pluralibacter gergoviae]|uniref:helix-turn-helix transcriptional regulator n=1 Tax=Pluralibacter gergoviae TaxID=61647 RepID=UPI000650E701|nr:helix-turn-helix transcriptional regulator [Pluralibacter gergoviae]KMK09529.1 AraC family transcriptional regulator [Pluralibacter gergoviae]
MSEPLVDLLRGIAAQPERWSVRFPVQRPPAPALSMCVPFPRLEIVLEGEVRDGCLPAGDDHLRAQQALYIPAGRWNLPQWDAPALTLSILFSKQKLGFSLQRWSGKGMESISKQHVARLGPRVGSYLLMAMNELALLPAEPALRLTFAGLISHCVDQLTHLPASISKSQALLRAIQEYVDDNAGQSLSRDSVAKRFHITPNYLSHLFQKAGQTGFNDYLTAVRLEQAKKLLRGYDMKIKEIAHRCGFEDSNYFCRLFRRHTARSPTEYRRHCRTL